MVQEAVRPVDRIVVPVQGTDREFFAQTWAVELASALGLGIWAIHVRPHAAATMPEPFAYLQHECQQWEVPLETKILHGDDVVHEIVEELRPRDLVVVGTAKLASNYHVGSIAADLVRRAPCPVQIVRLEGAHTPSREAGTYTRRRRTAARAEPRPVRAAGARQSRASKP